MNHCCRRAAGHLKIHGCAGSAAREDGLAVRPIISRRATACLAFGVVSLSLCAPGWAASDAEVAELRRMLTELQAQNRELSRRLSTLEAEIPADQRRRRPAPQATATTAPAPRPPPESPVPRPAPSAQVPQAAEAAVRPAPPGERAAPRIQTSPSTMGLEERVRELELSRAAQESATRSIIGDALTTLGPNINQFVALGGALETRVGRFRGFQGPWQETIELSTAELDFDIKIGDWVFGSLILDYDPGTSVLFQTPEGFPTGADRFTVNRALITVGDPQLFPFFIRAGRDVLDFGTATGIARLDTLSLSGPLTTDAFETREDFVTLGFALPTPPLAPLPPPVAIPPVQPMVVNPLVRSAVDFLGYAPPITRPRPLVAVQRPPIPPPFYGNITFYHGNREALPNRRIGQNINASLGYFALGSCGRNYEELLGSWFCPWSIDFHVDYLSSVFDSNFLRFGYRPFLQEIGTVPGLAASLKASFGPFYLVGEFNTATKVASFVDAAGRRQRINPAAWQVSFGYQFDWNPWVEKVGEQGTYVALTYSGTKDLAGATQLVNGEATRVGSLPRSRLAFTVGEWVFPNLRLATELQIDWDYTRRDGGTGKTGTGIFTSLLLTF
jgi:uncharacterized coiled-coil protein SlyX